VKQSNRESAKPGNLTKKKPSRGIRLANFIQKTGLVKKLQGWGRGYSPWPVQFGLGCCMAEGAAAMACRFDTERFGVLPLFGPRQCDVLMISGVVTKKMLPRLIRIYEQMPDPKYVICFGQCPTSGGVFWDSYSMVFDIEKHIPVDVFVPACPPKPEDLVRGFMLLEEKIKNHETEWDKTHMGGSK
jgi:NADH-quinone oxidoreductase subunit B